MFYNNLDLVMLFHGYQILLISLTIITVMVIVAWRDTAIEKRNINKNIENNKVNVLKFKTLFKETFIPFIYHLTLNFFIGFDFFILKPILIFYFICSFMFGLFINIQKRYFLEIVETLH